MKLVSLQLLLWLLSAVPAANAADAPAHVNVGQLIHQVPVLSLSEPGIRSFALRAVLSGNGVTLGFAVHASRPNAYSVRVFDTSDDTPILVGYDKKMVFYDPTADHLVLAGGIPTFVLNVKPHKPTPTDKSTTELTLGFGLDAETKPGKQKQGKSISVDLRSFLQIGNAAPVVQKARNGDLVLTRRTKDGSKTVARFRYAGGKAVINEIDLYTPHATSPMLTLSHIRINYSASGRAPEFPTRKLRLSGLKISHITQARFQDYTGMKYILRAFLARLVVSTGKINIDAAHQFKKIFKTSIDWPRVRARDRKVSRILKSIFPLQAENSRNKIK